MTALVPLTGDDAARAADGLDRAHRFVTNARKAYLRLDPGPGRDAAAKELDRAEAGVRYAALVLRAAQSEMVA